MDQIPVPTSITLSLNLVQAVASYLETQPYKDVAHLLGGINAEAQQQQAAPAEAPAEAPVAPEATTAPTTPEVPTEAPATPSAEAIAQEAQSVS